MGEPLFISAEREGKMMEWLVEWKLREGLKKDIYHQDNSIRRRFDSSLGNDNGEQHKLLKKAAANEWA